MGTTKNPPSPPSSTKKGAASHTLSIKLSKITSSPMPMPRGITKVACSKRMRMDATTAPTAVPMATTPTSEDAWVTLYPKAAAAHANTM